MLTTCPRTGGSGSRRWEPGSTEIGPRGRVALVPLTAAFFAGRVVSYTVYLLGAKASEGTSLEKVVTSSFTNPWLVALELVLVTGLVIMLAGATRQRS